jgi:hypothetical protein
LISFISFSNSGKVNADILEAQYIGVSGVTFLYLTASMLLQAHSLLQHLCRYWKKSFSEGSISINR